VKIKFVDYWKWHFKFTNEDNTVTVSFCNNSGDAYKFCFADAEIETTIKEVLEVEGIDVLHYFKAGDEVYDVYG